MPKGPAAVFPADSHGRIWGWGSPATRCGPFAGGGRKRRHLFKNGRWRSGSALEDMRRPSPGAAMLLHEKGAQRPLPFKNSLSESVSATRFGNNEKYGFSFFHLFACLFLMQVRNSKE